MTPREMMVYRGASLEHAWRGMCLYSENVERIVAAQGRNRLAEMIQSGIISERVFNDHRAYFEAVWYYRVDWMRPHPEAWRG